MAYAGDRVRRLSLSKTRRSVVKQRQPIWPLANCLILHRLGNSLQLSLAQGEEKLTRPMELSTKTAAERLAKERDLVSG